MVESTNIDGDSFFFLNMLSDKEIKWRNSGKNVHLYYKLLGMDVLST